MAEKRTFHDFVGLTTDVSVLLREICIVALFFLLFFWPAAFKSLLTRVGISQVTTPFGDIDVSDAGGTVATLNSGLQDSIERLQQIQSTVKDPRTNSDLQSITDKLKNLQQDAETTDETIKSNLVTRQATLEKTSSQSVKNPGWLLAGHVDKDGLNWVGDSARKIPATLSPKFTQGEQFSVTSPAYLRADVPFRISLQRQGSLRRAGKWAS